MRHATCVCIHMYTFIYTLHISTSSLFPMPIATYIALLSHFRRRRNSTGSGSRCPSAYAAGEHLRALEINPTRYNHTRISHTPAEWQAPLFLTIRVVDSDCLGGNYRYCLGSVVVGWQKVCFLLDRQILVQKPTDLNRWGLVFFEDFWGKVLRNSGKRLQSLWLNSLNFEKTDFYYLTPIIHLIKNYFQFDFDLLHLIMRFWIKIINNWILFIYLMRS